MCLIGGVTLQYGLSVGKQKFPLITLSHSCMQVTKGTLNRVNQPLFSLTPTQEPRNEAHFVLESGYTRLRKVPSTIT